MATPLNLILVEDSEDDALLLIRHLKKGGYEPEYRIVENQVYLERALADQHWDLVITDHNLPNFSSGMAINTVRNFSKDIPVIIVSGTIGEEIAVMAMRSGASDYIMKDNLTRLVPAIQRELNESIRRKSHREAEQQILYMANHDALTGLTNRFGFDRKMHEMLSEAIHGKQHALLYIDLDQFKLVNDTCGHTAGDELLRQLSAKLRKIVTGNELLSRLGGDEFGVLISDCSLEQAKNIADDIIKSIKAFRFPWKDKNFSISASIGMVIIDGSFRLTSEIMSAADIACYTAKEAGRNRAHIYSQHDINMSKRHVEMAWVTKIQAAIEENRFQLYKQSISDLKADTANHHCFEFLLRLVNEDGEIIMPGAFIPAAERFGIMPDIDRCVIEKAITCLNNSEQQNNTLAFINLSGATITDKSIKDYVLDNINKSNVKPGQICFELTETAAISNLEAAIEFISEIRDIGCHFALDDFGSGMCSFSYLRSLPIDFIKIDGEFVRRMQDDKMNHAIVEAINNIAHVAGLKTIGEYAENEQIIQNLKEIGLDFAQGYGIEMPSLA